MADAASGSVDRSVQVKLVLLGKPSQLSLKVQSTLFTLPIKLPSAPALANE
jgi:hypothetical protein